MAKRLQYNRVIPGVSLSWGLVCLANGFVKNFAGLAVCRLLLGLFEGFLFPSMVLMMANYYRREELGYRVGWVYSEYPLGPHQRAQLMYFQSLHRRLKCIWRSNCICNPLHERRCKLPWLEVVSFIVQKPKHKTSGPGS